MMHKRGAALISVGFFLVAPGTVVGLVPWLISRWRFHEPLPGWVVAQVVGAVLAVAGLVPAVSAFAEFVRASGTPVPLAPTEHLVVSGFNRWVRNPMYVGLLVSILGQALLFGSAWLLVWAAVAWAAPAAFVHWYEEPTLARTFGEEYERYRRAVPAWIPRPPRKPRDPGSGSASGCQSGTATTPGSTSR